jgi:leader peptidase (prepilin peptidase)/N-methyltransferase
VDTALVAGATLAGLAVGAALDPIGQRLADRSRAEDERRQAERAGSDPGAAGPEPPAPTADQAAAPAAVRHLVPAGRSPARHTAAAVATGLLFGAAAWRFGADIITAPFCVFFAMLVTVSLTDLTHRLVPRHLLYGAMALVVPLLVATSAVDHRWHSLSGSAIAGLVAFGVFFAVWWFVPRGMGFGDVRLAAAIGVSVGYLSLLQAYVAFLAGFVIGLVFGLVVMVVSSTERRTRIPFAPSLAAGAVLAVLWGGHVAHGLFHAGG